MVVVLCYNFLDMLKRKKAPSVKIPSSILKREAQRAAKKMMQEERLKEKKKTLKEKAKEKATGQIEKKKERQEHWQTYMTPELKRDIVATVLLGFAVILLALYFSEAPVSVQITAFIQSVFGVGTWLLPVFLVFTGGALLLYKNLVLPAGRILSLVILFCSLLGVIHLFSPREESIALAHKFGGNIGFALSFLPRDFFGEWVAGIILFLVALVAALIGFNIRLSDLIHGKETKDASAVKTVKNSEGTAASQPASVVAKESEVAPRFVNELKIIDSTGHNNAPIKRIAGKTLQMEAKDELTENKNKTFHHWQPPSLDLLKDAPSTVTVNEKDLRAKAEAIREKFDQFGIAVSMKAVHVGPTVTQFTLDPAAGVKLNKISSLKDDLALALSAKSLRIEAPIPGQGLVGIEIPNDERSTVSMKEILESDAWDEMESPLKLALGRDVAGKPQVYDLAKAPHLLIAGKTGSGKSVAMNAFLMSLLWQNSPEDLRLILVDPKRVELKPYDHLPHLLTPVITEPEKAVSALAWAVAEMNRRYRQLSETGVRNLAEYNEKHFDKPEPYIVIVIDELADLMMVAGKDVEAAICRIAQMARAVGMHLIVATQRPSVDVVTGLIKANLPTRVAFRVSSGIDSRTIIDGVGAEDLLGFGDMLHLDGNSGMLSRIQGLYVTNEEVERVTNHIKLQFPEMMANDEVTKQSIEGMAKGGVLTAGTENHGVADEDLDEKFGEAVALALETGKASASFFQRRLEVGYARAARIIDQMEAKGVVGPAKGAKPREILQQVPDVSNTMG